MHSTCKLVLVTGVELSHREDFSKSPPMKMNNLQPACNECSFSRLSHTAELFSSNVSGDKGKKANIGVCHLDQNANCRQGYD